MKVGLITIYSESNFGNRLQNYAACRVLSEMGFDAETLVLRESLSLRRRFRRLTGRFFVRLLPRTAALLLPDLVRTVRFREFTEANVPTRFVSREVLRNGSLNSEYGFFAVGSDQVWNPTFYFVSRDWETMLLTFVPPEKRLSFSASFGVKELPDEWRELFRDALLEYAVLTVREASGAELIRRLTGRTDAVPVIDPTLAIDPSEWMRLAKAPRGIPSRYVLDAFLGEPQTADETGSVRRIALLDKALRECGPSEFLYLIANAEAVFTDSYHACIFAILFGKPVTVFRRCDGNADMLSRMEGLFELFGLNLEMCLGKAVVIAAEERERVASEGKRVLCTQLERMRNEVETE